MKRVLWWMMVFALAIGVGPQPEMWAAGGSSVTSASPADRATDAYNRGIEHRDKAWQLEKEAAEAASPDRREKLEGKAQKEYEKAVRAFRTAIEADADMHQAHGSLGYALRKIGDYQQSLEAYNRALELRPDYTEAVEYRAEAYLGLNRLQEAKDAYMQLFRDDRKRADELMAAMQRWLEQRSAEPAGLSEAELEEFAAWVKERAEIAGQTASLAAGETRTW